jgi:anti-sigma factor RsiW
MKCRDVVELMTEYLEGALSASDRARFEDHIAGCDGCRAYLEQLRATRSVSSHVGEVMVPEELERELVEAFRSWKRTRP